LWKNYNRIIKDNGAILLFAQLPFDKILGCSNLEMLRYEWVWVKEQGTGSLNVKKMPLKKTENILVFYKKLPTYNPQMTAGKFYKIKRKKCDCEIFNRRGTRDNYISENKGVRYPTNILNFNRELNQRFHPTQKPVKLCEYLIKTYTNEDETVLDTCAGSGTVAIASINTKRNYILIEKEERYFQIIKRRIKNHNPLKQSIQKTNKTQFLIDKLF